MPLRGADGALRNDNAERSIPKSKQRSQMFLRNKITTITAGQILVVTDDNGDVFWPHEYPPLLRQPEPEEPVFTGTEIRHEPRCERGRTAEYRRTGGDRTSFEQQRLGINKREQCAVLVRQWRCVPRGQRRQEIARAKPLPDFIDHISVGTAQHGIGMGFERRQETRQGIRQPEIIRIKKGDVGRRRFGHARIARHSRAAVDVMAEDRQRGAGRRRPCRPSSVDASSMTMIAAGRSVCADMLSSARRISPARLRMATMTVTSAIGRMEGISRLGQQWACLHSPAQSVD
jgi:hypothetical protein